MSETKRVVDYNYPDDTWIDVRPFEDGDQLVKIEFSDRPSSSLVEIVVRRDDLLRAVRQQSGPPAAAEPVAITEAEVEAVAVAIYDFVNRRTTVNLASYKVQADIYREQARAVLEAAESARRGEGK